MQMTAKQKAFCKEYIVDLNATHAAIRAGYSKNGANVAASRLLAHVSIRQAVQEEMDKRASRTDITADYVLNGIKEVIERCTQRTPVVVDGVETGEYKFQAAEALKGYELLGKHLRLYVDKVETESVSMEVRITKEIM